LQNISEPLPIFKEYWKEESFRIPGGKHQSSPFGVIKATRLHCPVAVVSLTSRSQPPKITAMDTERHPMPVLSFVGRSGSGKTTFLEKLIPLLVARGHRVGALKHTHHSVEIDKPGKDSYRLREAGAVEVVTHAPNLLALIRKQSTDLPLEEVLSYFRETDIVLVEGYKGAGLPRIEIFRKDAGHSEPLFLHDTPPQALVTDVSFPEITCPVFALDDDESVADWLETDFLRNRHS